LRVEAAFALPERTNGNRVSFRYRFAYFDEDVLSTQLADVRPQRRLVTLHQSRICKGCWQQMRLPVPLRGVISAPFRLFGIRPSRMNPNTCTVCELMFTRVMKARKVTIDATVMFADLRGYTSLSQSQSPDAMSGLLDAFYDECANAIWEYDGLLTKTIGDAVMAVFNFPMKQDDHPRQAVLTARVIQRRWSARRAMLIEALGLTSDVGIGIGLHCGELSFGEFGRSHRDLTAIGTVVNTAARAQSAAASGEILLTQEVYERARSDLMGSQAQEYGLKGFEAPVRLYAA
jgi:adenylate cyclase